MFLISKKRLLLYFFFVLVFLMAEGIFAYWLLNQFEMLPESHFRFLSEWYLYFLILGGLLLLVLSFLLLSGSRNFNQSIEKMLSINRLTGASPEHAMRKLGKPGKRLAHLFDQLNSLSRKKSLKISSLKALCDLICNTSEIPIMVFTVEGKASFVNRAFMEKMEKSRLDLLSSNIKSLFPEWEIAEIILKMERKPGSLQRKHGKQDYSLYPIYNVDGHVSFLVVFLGKNPQLPFSEKSQFIKKQEKTAEKAETTGNLFRRFFSRPAKTSQTGEKNEQA